MGGIILFRFFVGLMLLILSMTGYLLFLKKKIVVEFIPVITFSGIISVLFIGGLLNVLKLVILIVVFLGLFLFALTLWKSKNIKSEFKVLLNPGMLFFLFFCILFGITTRNTVFLHYDNFSHWALIVKAITLNGTLPSFQTPVITFTSYPPGSALFIYFFIKVIGVTEANAILGQGLLIFSCIMTLFVWPRKFNHLTKNGKKMYAPLILIVTLSLYLLNGPTNLKDLLVDNLLLLFATATMNVILFYFNDFKKALLLSLPLFTSMLLIKNSGVIFVGINLIVLCFSGWKHVKKNGFSRQFLISTMTILAIPWFLFYLWVRHVAYVFPNGVNSKHSMSLTYYKQILSEKTFADIIQITKAFVFRMFDYKVFPLFFDLLIFSGLAIAILVFIRKKENLDIKIFKNTIIGINIVFLGYMTILWSMYLLSMPLGEAKMLASFDRYTGGIFNFLLVGIILQVLFALMRIKNIQLINLICISLSAVLLFVMISRSSDYIVNFSNSKSISSYWKNSQEKVNDALPDVKNTLISEDTKHTYVVYMPSSENDAGYANYYAVYRLYNKEVRFVRQKNSEELTNKLQSNSYLVVVDRDEFITKYIEDKQLKLEENGLYSIK